MDEEENFHASREFLLPDRDEPKEGSISLFHLFRETSFLDRFLLVIGSIIAIGSGLGKPLFASLTGHVTKEFINFTNEVSHLNKSDPRRAQVFEEFHSQVVVYCLLYLSLAVWSFSTATAQSFCFTIVGENLVNRLRKQFIKAIMRQEIGWFDSQKTGSLATELFSHLDRVKEGTGSNIGQVIQQLAMFTSGFAVCFYSNWKLALVAMSMSPLLVVWGIFTNSKSSKLAEEQEAKNSEAGAVAEQALTAIRTVMVFNGQELECNKYENVLKQIQSSGISYTRFHATWTAVSKVLMNISYFLTVWFGTNMIIAGEIEVNSIITIFFTILLVVADLDVFAPIVSNITKAKAAAGALYTVIDRVPEVDAYSQTGLHPPISGRIEIRNLRFNYPTRPDVQVLKNMTFTVEPGQTVALVGASGSGKSTIVQLLLRNYVPQDGSITIDGTEIEEINVEYLRRTIGVVSQEPALFNTTIEENIRYGKENISEGEIWKALKKANAEEFIKTFPEGLKTLVGDRGTQLSGGQKQRIAIARALVRDPKILLLDEATSALDAQSETIVQQALENAAKGRTTLVIAHRLSTIKNADKIIAMKNGEITEVGTHDELMEKKGLYFELVNNQIFIQPAEPTTPATPATPAGLATRFRFSRSISTDLPGSPTEFRRFLSGIPESVPEEDESDEDVGLKRLKEELSEENTTEVSLWRIYQEARPDGLLVFFSIFISIAEGFFYPAFSFGFTELIKLNLFGVVAQRLALRLRIKAYRNIMRQDTAYFDRPTRSTGRLLTRLAVDTNNIKSAINSRLGTVLNFCTIDIVAYSIAFYFGWQMAIVAIPVFTPCYMAFGLQARYLRKRILREEKEMESCGKIAMEAIENIRTVQALTLQQKIHSKFCKHLEIPIRTGREKAIVLSVAYGITQAIHFTLYCICFRAGLFLIYHEYLEPQAMLRSMFMVTLTSIGLGAITAYFPEYMKAKMAASLVFKMIDEEPKIDSMTGKGTKPDIRGNIVVNAVHFCYPERQETVILNGVSLEVKEGQTVALVGPSGCGKSTVVALLERMYDPKDGTIEIDGNLVAAMNPKHLRSNISIVSQEPVLFDMSIKENILYGLPENSVSHLKMIEAAKKANIHEFISCLPDAYQTRVGDKGTQLSGGQKQRIAIARALVREPKILLLDEATSALDTESEKHVQLALEQASEGRSCLVVAHRLSTIRNAHQIVVFSNGKIAEKGTHDELMKNKGVYFNLVQKQSSENSHRTR